jgi:hypothetical protein
MKVTSTHIHAAPQHLPARQPGLPQGWLSSQSSHTEKKTGIRLLIVYTWYEVPKSSDVNATKVFSTDIDNRWQTLKKYCTARIEITKTKTGQVHMYWSNRNLSNAFLLIYIYISTKPSDSQQYMFIIIYRLKTEQQDSAAFGHHQAQIQKLVLAKTVHEWTEENAFTLQYKMWHILA